VGHVVATATTSAVGLATSEATGSLGDAFLRPGAGADAGIAATARPHAEDVAALLAGAPKVSSGIAASLGVPLALASVVLSPADASSSSILLHTELELHGDGVPASNLTALVGFAGVELAPVEFDLLRVRATRTLYNDVFVLDRSFTDRGAALAFFDDEFYRLVDPTCHDSCSGLNLDIDFLARDPNARFAVDIIVATPEPATGGSLALGLVLLAIARRPRVTTERRRRR
jgi:hypothetical protein